jgi:hypothetical protein
MFLMVFVLVLFNVFSCSKKTVKISENETEYVITPEKEEESVSTFSLDQNTDIVINIDNEIYEKILGNWVIFERNEQQIRPYDITRFDDDYTLGFYTDHFWRYSSMEGGYELAWKVEDGKIHIINNNQNEKMKIWIDTADEMIGAYDITFVDEKIIFLKHENGNIYKCYLYKK